MSSESPFRPVLERTLDHALEHLEGLESSSVAATASLEELRSRLGRPLESAGVDPTRVIEELVADVSGGILGSAGGRFFAWVVGGSVPAALAADWLTSAWDQNAALYACSPAGAAVEEVCGAWLKEILGLPETSSFALITGCQMAHVTCLAAARHALLEQRGWNVERRGLAGAPPIRILTGDQRHASATRAIRLLGLGEDHVVDLPVDAAGRLRPTALAEALRGHEDAPTILLLQAGDLNIGAYDPFSELIPMAHDSNAWVHVDGAFGLWVAASPEFRHLLNCVELADSWATDGHKWLNVPYDCGYAFVADPEAHRRSMSQRASYLIHDDDARDPMDWNPEWSRRARGFATYAALRQLGRGGLADLIERCCRHAHALVAGIGSLDNAEVLWEPQINQGLVRFVSPRSGATESDHDRFTDAVISETLGTGEAFFGGTTWRGKRCMRISVSSWQTRDEDILRVVAAVENAIHLVSAE